MVCRRAYTVKQSLNNKDSMKTHDSTDKTKLKSSHPWRKAGLISLCVMGGIVLLAIILLAIGTWMLTPERLTKIVNEDASRYLKADVRAHNVNYKFWSTFPYLELEMDSVTVISRALDGIPAEQRAQLPANANFLMSAGHTIAGINICGILSNEVNISEILVDKLKINLVELDSVHANYLVLPPERHQSIKELPRISFDQIRISRPDIIQYRNITAQNEVKLQLDSLMTSKMTADDEYVLTVSGNVSAIKGINNLIDELPFSIAGNIGLKFRPLGVTAKNLAVNVANMRNHIDAAVTMNKETTLIERFAMNVEKFNVNGLLKYLSADGIPTLQGVNADFIAEGNGELLSPYKLNDSTQRIPTAKVELNIPSGNIAFDAPVIGHVDLSEFNLAAMLNLDGSQPDNSSLALQKFNVGGEGTDLSMEAEITDLFDDPRVRAKLSGIARLNEIGRAVGMLRKMNLGGDFNTDTRLDFRLSHLQGGELERVRISGKSKLKNLRANNVGPLSTIKANNMTLAFNGDASDITQSAINGTVFDMDFHSDQLTFSAPGMKGNVKDFRLNSAIIDRQKLAYNDAATTLPIKIKVSTGAVNVVDPKDTLMVHVRNTSVGGIISAVNPTLKDKRNMSLKVKGEKLNYTHGTTSIDIDHVLADVSASRLKKDLKVKRFIAPKEWSVDDYTSKFVKSMPRTIECNLPESARDFLTGWELSASLKMDRGMMLVPAFPVRNYLSDIDIYANLDSISIRSFNIHSLKSGANIQMTVSNLRQFLLNPEPAPLKIDLVANVDTVQINQLAAAYERGVINLDGPNAIEHRLMHTAITAADSVAIAIPRNILANIKAHVEQTEYEDVHFYDIDGNMLVKNGRVIIDTISVHAPFGSAWGRIFFDSSNIENLNAKIRIGDMDMDVTKFFNTFPKLVAMMPQVKNLSGNIGAQANVSIHAFPTMYADIPSAIADLYVQGNDLELKQDKFIRKITRMMLIPGDNPIDIENVNIHASVHDNMLMLYPVDFMFKDYHLELTGLNNFGGDLFYHLGIEESPLHIPFGINIKGTFHHPELRFGGSKWKNTESIDVTSNIMDNIAINLIQTVRNANNKFIHKAALGAHTPESAYVNFPTKH